MANLEERYAAWRRTLAEALGGSAETLEELEQHLRDEVARRIAAGESADAAFGAAAERVGSPTSLAAEFARAVPVTPWLPVRLALVVLIAGTGLLVGMLMPRAEDALGMLLGVHIAAITLGYSITLLIGSLAACYILARPFGGPAAEQRESLVRATRWLTFAALVLTGCGIILGGFWAQQRLGRFWGWDAKETGGLAVLLWDVAMFVVLSKRLGGDHGPLVLGLAGNVIVIGAWFGPNLLGLGLHSYGATFGGVSVAVFVLANLALAALAFVPAGALRRRAKHG
jgi:hypothetical protein